MDGRDEEGGREGPAFTIQSGVYISYLTTTLEGQISDTLDDCPQATRPTGLPLGPARTFLCNDFGRHFYTPCIPTHPTIARVLAMGSRRPPSPLELLMAAESAYRGSQQACLSSAPELAILAQRYDISPRALDPILMTTHWSCDGLYDATFLPTVPYIARLALQR